MGLPSRRPDRLFPARGRRLVEGHPIIGNFFADRCPHLAAMVAYYALLSLVPLLFLVLSLTGLVGRPDESSELVRELNRIVPGSSIEGVLRLVRSLQRNATELGLIGLFGLVWTSLGLLSSLESALNIVFDVPNRPFVRQKLVVFSLVGGGIVTLFVSLAVATTAHAFLLRHAPGLIDVSETRLALTLAASTLITFCFMLVLYRALPNTELRVGQVLAGTIVATVLFQISFEALPLYLRFTSGLPALRAFGGAAVLLVWLYLMGNIVLLGAEINWWVARGRDEQRLARSAVDEAMGHA